MDTPEQPEGGFVPALYGESGGGINRGLAALSRRAMVAGGLAMPVAAWAGGARLPAVKALDWEGIGEVPIADSLKRLVVRTHVEPFLRARSTSYLEERGGETARTLIVDSDGAWLETQAARVPLPKRQADHERAQYGLYGYLLSACDYHFHAQRSVLNHDGYPPIAIQFDEQSRPIGATYSVPSNSDAGVIPQRIAFEGAISDKGVTWPRRLTILVDGKLSFRMTFDHFAVQLA